jgi:hypothetical protein
MINKNDTSNYAAKNLPHRICKDCKQPVSYDNYYTSYICYNHPNAGWEWTNPVENIKPCEHKRCYMRDGYDHPICDNCGADKPKEQYDFSKAEVGKYYIPEEIKEFLWKTRPEYYDISTDAHYSALIHNEQLLKLYKKMKE